jgi:branched-chain amino acid transport system substrate-binding protein
MTSLWVARALVAQMTRSEGKMRMRHLFAAGAVMLVCLSAAIAGTGTVKVGLIVPDSGEYAQWGAKTKGGIEAYQKLHGTAVNGTRIDVLMRDEGGINPARARQLATELVLRDHIQFLAGFVFSPDALAVADIISQANCLPSSPMPPPNSSCGRVPYFVRVSFTVEQEAARLSFGRRDTGSRPSMP